MSKLDQGQINPIKNNIAKILKNYSINNFDFSVNPRGAHNTTIIITEKGGNKYAMRVYCQNRRTKNEIRLEIDYINFLFNRGLPVPEVVPVKKNNYIASLKSPFESTESVKKTQECLGCKKSIPKLKYKPRCVSCYHKYLNPPLVKMIEV